MKTTPFYYGGSVGDEHFCNRVAEIKELRGDVLAGLNIPPFTHRGDLARHRLFSKP